MLNIHHHHLSPSIYPLSDQTEPTHTEPRVARNILSSSPCNSPSILAPPTTPSLHSLKELWKDSGLNRQVIQNLIHTGQIPNQLTKRIIRCILEANHLEIVLPSASKVTRAVNAALISFITTSHQFNKHQIAISSPITLTSPTVLVVCLTSKKAERYCKLCKELAQKIEGIKLDQIHLSPSLSTELDELRSNDPISINRPILITTLSRLTLLFLVHQVISFDRLSILVLDFRDVPSSSLNHHLLIELEPVLNHIQPLVQILILHNLDARITPALSDLLAHKMESSIRANLSSHSSTATTTTGDPTPSLSSSSLSPNSSNSLSTSTPPFNVLNQNLINLPFNSIENKNQTHLTLLDHWNS